ncbi:hypothetical protein ACRBEV_04200 [Methylobacterium phyllosphaerae]
MELSDLEFWAFLALAIPCLFLPVIIVWWKGRPIVPIALLNLVFWLGALILALRLRRRVAMDEAERIMIGKASLVPAKRG